MQVKDLPLSELSDSEYDWAVYCNGYEERSTFVPTYMEGKRVRNSLVLGFVGETKPNGANVDYFTRMAPSRNLSLGAQDGHALAAVMSELLAIGKTRVLVDYSSMPRDWYAAIAVAALECQRPVEVDFVYSTATHSESIGPPAVDDYYNVFGCETVSLAGAESTMIVGFGFEGSGPLHATAQYEPDHILAYAAHPPSAPGYFERTMSVNRLFIDRYLQGSQEKVLRFPIWSMETTLRGLSELISRDDEDGIVVLAPFGPKPFVLASVLLAVENPRVACINARKSKQTRSAAPATGDLVLARMQTNAPASN
jgi:hypothetical protein